MRLQPAGKNVFQQTVNQVVNKCPAPHRLPYFRPAYCSRHYRNRARRSKNGTKCVSLRLAPVTCESSLASVLSMFAGWRQ